MTPLADKRVLITGGRGFLGGHLVDRFRRAGCREVIAPSRLEYDLTRARDQQKLFAVEVTDGSPARRARWMGT